MLVLFTCLVVVWVIEVIVTDDEVSQVDIPEDILGEEGEEEEVCQSWRRCRHVASRFQQVDVFIVLPLTLKKYDFIIL